MSHHQGQSSGDLDEPASSTPTPSSRLHRSMSRSSQRSQTADNHQSWSSPSSRPGPTPILLRTGSSASMARGPSRSFSVNSIPRHLHDDDVSERDEDEDDDEDEDGSEGTHRARSRIISDDGEDDEDEDPITVRERQSMINVEHPFGLPIWKPALYKKSRSVTRHADEALHSVPSAQAERHLLPGNILWLVVFGWWLALVTFFASAILYVVPQGGKRYSNLLFGLGWYIAWPFGKYVEGAQFEVEEEEEEEEEATHERQLSAESSHTVRDAASTVRAGSHAQSSHVQTLSWNPVTIPGEHTSLLQTVSEIRPSKSYGATVSPASDTSEDSIGVAKANNAADLLGKICFWTFIVALIAPLMLIVCLICWGLVVTIPMAKLNWALLKHLFTQPHSIRFCAAPPAVVVAEAADEEDPESPEDTASPTSRFSVKHPRISPGQVAPSGSSKVLLCIYRAVGWKYYKYTVGGVNILFINLLPVVFCVIIDGLVLLPMVEHKLEHGQHVHPLLAIIASQGLIFVMSLLSVIPLSYFIGMAVASISAQSSIGMGAVINATFGSIIEIILYGMALSQSKGHLVEGSIIGSLLAGVLLMPGMSMVSSAIRRKEQRFNAKSAGVTSMMLIMALIGTLAPTLFYQTYGNFQLVCKGCPTAGPGTSSKPWICDQCYYKHPDPVDDPFYQATVKTFMYFCAVILVLSYLIGLWFSLRTHASQIWQNPQQLLHQDATLPTHNRLSVYQRLVPPHVLRRKESRATNVGERSPTPHNTQRTATPSFPRRVSHASGAGISPVIDTVHRDVKNSGLQPLNLPEAMTADDFTRAVAVATVSALRQHEAIPHSPAPHRVSGADGADVGGHGGHDAPSWSRTVSASVLLGCTLLYAIIAEILVDVVDVILQGSGIDEKFLGVTLFALVPNTTEFMNAMSFALNGNIALSMEIGSAYALQVCLLQIPAMVAFSAWYAPEYMGEVAKTFTLIFPRWDVIALILSMFLMTYTYIEAKSNYHRGSILILSYLVLLAGFYFAPSDKFDDEVEMFGAGRGMQEFGVMNGLEYAKWWVLSWLPL
ncbi:hypothetical protein CYLTODRAFT_379736 [Cylindrobasidium torrendii FP15055 ss-10]|uniref:Calcium permease n=1 Tax=Cylindrobasidium torrendii FP15055 ss-10 TaxID=1314674 RepID=A0A0D7B3T5_9AGAR|nr:hypothetical protein CYLTODRAFT_379736 [Cylindrobasidium torrendii FP15055 ss-10]